MKHPIEDRPFFCSWSGGKDSCLALHRAIQRGGEPKYLLTMMVKDGTKSRAHGLPKGLFEAQAHSLGIPLEFRSTSRSEFRSVMIATLRELKEKGVEFGVFGDIDLEQHLEWVEGVCSSAKIQPYEPLWQLNRQRVVRDFLNLGFKALIIAVKHDVMDPAYLGSMLNRECAMELEKSGIDSSGEGGEFHTVVTDGPIFSSPIQLKINDTIIRDGRSFLNVSIEEK